ncbi:MAG: DNA mismatch repair protein MutS [Promethearchaeota archaeon]
MTIEDINVKELTPMMRHWFEIKKQYPEHLIAYRMGDFYEFFYDDAIKISNLIGITLTKRKLGNSSYPLAGIPHHSVSNHFNNLINQGQTLVLVDQLEDPSTVKGRIVKRGVTRILSPGTVVDFNFLKSNKNNYIASMVRGKNGYGIAFADLSTGEFETQEFSSKERDPIETLLSMVSQYDPVEIVLSSDLKNDERLFILLQDLTDAVIKTYDDYVFNNDKARETILRHFKISNLAGFGLETSRLAVCAAGGLLAFLKETQRDILPNIFKINLIKDASNLHLDYITQRNLELISSLWEKGKEVTLYSIFNKTHTPMGSRLLKKIILNPLNDIKEINYRLNIVQKFKDDIFLRSDLREKLKVVGDLERFINRVNYTTRTNARDLVNIRNSLEIMPTIKSLLEKANIPEISPFLEKITDFREIRDLIEMSIKDEPPITIKEGNLIREGFNEQVDELRDLLNNGMKYILEYESELKKIWNLNTGLKIGHNNILGYYIQITHNTLKSISKVPDDFIERAHLKNAKRYTTERLKTLEEKIVSAEEKINDIEYEIFCTIRDKVIEETQNILETARNIALLDVLTCFAEISEKYNFCRPIVNEDTKIIIKQGRHPVVEQININEPFIPNDCYLDIDDEQILIITGPNMAGKSTFLRQVALICIVAQMGCFVPAKSATIGIIDQIFTRIGASDDLARKLSTFMIEMTETAKILNYATPKSLVIIDELGRGTSTSDGQSIAMATLEKLHDLKTKTLFSTHYHQLTEINLPRIKNFHLDIIENEDGSINFVRKLRQGSTDKSYGIHVAKLAGIPDDVIIRAFEILEQIEEKDPFKSTVKKNGNGSSSEKYYDKFINEKKRELENLNSEIIAKKTEINEYERRLKQKQETIKTKEIEFNELKENISKRTHDKNIISSKRVTEKPKKSVQTTFFKPVIKTEKIVDKEIEELKELINDVDINSLTPVDAMKLMIKLKKKLGNFTSKC